MPIHVNQEEAESAIRRIQQLRISKADRLKALAAVKEALEAITESVNQEPDPVGEAPAEVAGA